MRTLFHRNEKFELLPREVPLLDDETKSISMIPMCKGECNTFKQIDAEKDIICYVLQFLHAPKFTYSEFGFCRFKEQRDIVKTIMFESGFVFEEKKRTTRHKSTKRLDFERFKDDLGYAKEIFSLLKMGVSFQEYVLLTAGEIDLMFEAVKAEANNIKKMSRGNPKRLTGKR